MELTPQALHDVEFREARRNGYNTRDVDDFLERVAVGVGQLQDRLRDAYHRAEAAEARLADMQRQIDELQRRGPEPRESSPSDADETLRRTLVLAQRTADATIKEAQDEANRVLAEARGEAARTRASAESEATRLRASAESEALRDARAEVDHLSATREALLQDIDVLEQHLEEQRNQIRDGLSELQRLVDDPGTLRMEPPPKVTDVTMQSPHQPLGHELSGNGSFSTNGSSLVEQAALDASAAMRGHDDADDNGRPANDGSVVAALQELHRSDPGHDDEAPTQQQEALPARDLFPPPSEPLPQREPLAAREPLAQREPLPQRDPLPPREPLPQRDAFPPPGDPLPPREAFPPPNEPLPQRDAFPPPGDPLAPREAFPPPNEPLPQRDAFPPPGEPLPQREAFPPPGELPEREPFPPPGDPLAPRESLPSREPLAQRDVLPQREPLPQREALPSREPLPQREPSGSRDDLPQRASFPAASQPPPGTTGFLPDLRAAFDPPEPDAGSGRNDDDAGLLPIDAPPPPPPPPGFEHLQGAGGIPIEPGSRPSEWGRGVFDTDDDEDPAQGARFGRRH